METLFFLLIRVDKSSKDVEPSIKINIMELMLLALLSPQLYYVIQNNIHEKSLANPQGFFYVELIR